MSATHDARHAGDRWSVSRLVRVGTLGLMALVFAVPIVTFMVLSLRQEDEIGNIPLDTQGKLLRVIQEKEFMRLGGVDTIRVDVRIIAATNSTADGLRVGGAFREDLFYRLHVIPLTLPPLRNRKEDIPLLVEHFLDKYCHETTKRVNRIAPLASRILEAYDWPGNVRELENAVERAERFAHFRRESPPE